MQLDRPAPSGDLFTNADHVGDLLVFRVKDTREGVQTENGPADVIIADVSVIDQDSATVRETYDDAMIYGRVIYGRLKRQVGKTVCAVFAGEPGVKRNGKSVPYDLDDPTDAQMDLAVRALMAKPTPDPEPAREPAAAGAGKAPWE